MMMVYFGEIILIYPLLSHKFVVILWRKKLGNSLILMLQYLHILQIFSVFMTENQQYGY